MSWSYTSAIAYALPIVVREYQSGHRCLDEPFDILGYEEADTLEGELKAAATSLLGEGHGISIKYFEMKCESHCSMEPRSYGATEPLADHFLLDHLPKL